MDNGQLRVDSVHTGFLFFNENESPFIPKAVSFPEIVNYQPLTTNYQLFNKEIYHDHL